MSSIEVWARSRVASSVALIAIAGLIGPLLALIGGLAVSALLHGAVPEPGYHTMPAAWYDADLALTLRIPVVTVHVVGGSLVICALLMTVLACGFAAYRSTAIVAAMRHPLRWLLIVQGLFHTAIALTWATGSFTPWYFIWLSPIVAWDSRSSRYVRGVLLAALLYYALLYGNTGISLFGGIAAVLTAFVFFAPLAFVGAHRRD